MIELVVDTLMVGVGVGLRLSGGRGSECLRISNVDATDESLGTSYNTGTGVVLRDTGVPGSEMVRQSITDGVASTH
jgi:hypothetical protein